MKTGKIPGAAVVMVASALVGGLLGTRLSATQGQNYSKIDQRYRQYQAALMAIEKEYAEPVDQAQVVYGSIDGMLRTLDPHSSFLDPKEYQRQREQMSGHYAGIGISIISFDGMITVTQLFEGSPAYKAGIRRNDVIARVGQPDKDGKIAWEDTKGWATEDIVRRVRGAKGTTVEISIRRPGVDKLIDLHVMRDEIKITTVRTAFMLAPGTGYVRMQDFSETTDAELGEALAKLKAEGMQRLLLDIRDNPGGPLDQAIAVASRFLKSGQMVVYTRGNGRIRGTDEDYRARGASSFADVPLIVMVNRNSASASEIVSGAMQDHDRAILVGETTFGKALVQGVYTISEDAGVALTTGRYFTPSGRMIQRPWDGAFDEYLTYSYQDQKADRSHDPGQLKYTDAGRKVYSGGGIEPDHFVAGPVEGFNPSRFGRALRGAFVSFAERFTKEGDTRPAAASAAKYKVSPGWQVTDAMVAEFKDFVIAQRVRFDEAAFKADMAYVKAMIKFEVDADLFGIEEARRNLTKVDPQVQAAVGYFTEAADLIKKAPVK